MKDTAITCVEILSLFIFIIFGCDVQKEIQYEEGKISVNDIEIYYRALGEGEPIIVLHAGPGLGHNYLLPHLNNLSENYQLIFYDQRGSGLSEANIDSESITVNEFVKDIDLIRTHFGFEKIHIMGHSWGGYLAMKYAIINPNNVRSLLLVSSNGATEESLKDYDRIRAERMTSEDTKKMSEIFASEEFKVAEVNTIENLVRMFFKPVLYEASYIDSINFGISEYTAKNLFTIFGLLSNDRKGYDLTEQLKYLSIPTLIIHGNDDPLLPKYALVLHETISGSELVMIENSGHFPFVEQPERFTSAVTDFLLKLDSKR